MAIHDPLFSTAETTPSRPWWKHPAAIVLALMLIAAVLAWFTGKPMKARAPQEVQIEFEVIYDHEQDVGEAQIKDAAVETP